MDNTTDSPGSYSNANGCLAVLLAPVLLLVGGFVGGFFGSLPGAITGAVMGALFTVAVAGGALDTRET